MKQIITFDINQILAREDKGNKKVKLHTEEYTRVWVCEASAVKLKNYYD